MQPTRVLKYLALFAGSLSLVAAVGCGTGGSTTIINPQGNFSNASLNGSYVYELHGGFENNFNTFTPYREVGVFIADGKGHIGSPTPGSDDISGSTTPAGVTGTYQIIQDGTGTITMTSQLGTINLAVTLVSNSKVYLMEADNLNTTGLPINAVGVAELQNSSAITAAPSGAFAFRIHEEVSLTNQSSAIVGAFTVPGVAPNGAMDQNDGGTFSSPNITWTFNAPGTLGRGTGTYVNTSTNVTNNFIYYIVNNAKLILLASDANAVGSGEAEAQTGAVGNGLSGNYAFGSNGDDSNCLNGFCGTVATVGEFSASGGAITGMEDSNVDGTTNASVPTAGCFTASANGRVAVVSSSGSSCSASTVQVFWMVNPNRAFFLNVNSGTFDDGTADSQTVSSFSQSTLSGQFALIMGGIDITPELLTRVGTLQFNSGGNLTLDELANATVNGAQTNVLTGTSTVASNGRITETLSNQTGQLGLVIYAVSGSQAYVLQNDSGAITSGTVELQP